ncbi:MAG: GntR family transcriptional regulator [Thermodesulfobacteriota bacterium]
MSVPIKKQSLQKTVCETLRQAILEREIQPAEQINIRKLAEKLGVSTMPIREALRELEAEGLITFSSNKRILATRLSVEDLREIYSIRIPLEGIAIERCFEHENKQYLARLEELHRRMKRVKVTGAEWFNINRSFHMTLHEMAGSPRLFSILQGLWNSTGPYLRIFSDNKKAVNLANREHALLLDALRTGNRPQAKKVLRNHLQNGLKSVSAMLEGN